MQHAKVVAMKRGAQGFTLIELMIVVAIIGILASTAISVYTNYSIRAQVSEGISLSSAAKAAVSQYYAERGTWPVSNADVGLAGKLKIKGEYTEHVSVEDNVIEIKYGNSAHSDLLEKTVILTAAASDGSITWECSGGVGVKPGHLPPGCR